jgi:hypothetical protein
MPSLAKKNRLKLQRGSREVRRRGADDNRLRSLMLQILRATRPWCGAQFLDSVPADYRNAPLRNFGRMPQSLVRVTVSGIIIARSGVQIPLPLPAKIAKQVAARGGLFLSPTSPSRPMFAKDQAAIA